VTGLRFENWLPLLQWHDYRSSLPSPTTSVPPGAIPDYRTPFAVAQIGGKWYLTHDLTALANDETKDDDGSQFSSVVSAVPDSPALEVKPSSVPHSQALNHFDHEENGSDIAPTFDYERMAVTVFCEMDAYAEAVYPPEPTPSVNDHQSVLEIRFGDRARLDYVNFGTILDVENGELVTSSDWGFVRNDTPLLRDAARMAWLWYEVPRKAITMQIAHISSYLPLGYLMTQYDGEVVNSLITHVEHDFTGGQTIVRTHFAEIDVATMLL
jgi:hypothetical protein